ncbi:RepB family plasmid replication initiator protein [Plesiomonas shigelloides]|nr:RepB family plasmid replication initiator protein [Plesiomonas shigelloides]
MFAHCVTVCVEEERLKAPKDVVKQSNALTTAAYDLSRNEKRVLYLCLSKLYQKGALFNEVEKAYEIAIDYSDYAQIFSDENLSRDIYNAMSGLMKKKVVFYVPDNDDGMVKATKERSWITGFDNNPRNKKAILYLNASVFDIVSKTDREFTLYLMTVVGRINNPYAMRMYELIAQWRSSRTTFTHSIEWLKERFKLPKSYNRMPDFRRSFLNVVVKEINDNTDINLSVEELCEGERKNKVTHIKFSWSSKKTPLDPSLLKIQELYKSVLLGDLRNKNELIFLLENIDKYVGQGGIEKNNDFIVMWSSCMSLAD